MPRNKGWSHKPPQLIGAMLKEMGWHFDWLEWHEQKGMTEFRFAKQCRAGLLKHSFFISGQATRIPESAIAYHSLREQLAAAERTIWRDNDPVILAKARGRDVLDVRSFPQFGSHEGDYGGVHA